MPHGGVVTHGGGLTHAQCPGRAQEGREIGKGVSMVDLVPRVALAVVGLVPRVALAVAGLVPRVALAGRVPWSPHPCPWGDALQSGI